MNSIINEIKGLDCDSPRELHYYANANATYTNVESDSINTVNSRTINHVEQLYFIDFLAMGKTSIDIDNDELIFYTCIPDITSATSASSSSTYSVLRDYIYSPFINSEYIKIRTCCILGSLIQNFNMNDNTKATADTFINDITDDNTINTTKYYKVCLLEADIYNKFKKLFTLRSINDIENILVIADYMLLDSEVVTGYICKLLESIEKYAIAKYWNNLSQKPAYNEYLKHRMFKIESVEMTDYETVETFKSSKDAIKRQKEFYETSNDLAQHQYEINTVFCDEIPSLAENESKWDNKFDAFRAKYYCPPDSSKLIKRETAISLFEKVFEYCAKLTILKKYNLVSHVYRTFAIVPEFSHVVFAKEIQIIYTKMMIDLHNKNGTNIWINDSSEFREWNRFTGYAFYLMYIEECYYSTATTKNSRFIFASSDVEYWINSGRSLYTHCMSKGDYFSPITSGYDIITGDHNTTQFKVPAYNPFTIGSAGSLCYLENKVKVNNTYGYKTITNGIHKDDDIKDRLLVASNGLFSESFPWKECGLNLTGSLLVACTAVNIHDLSLDRINAEFVEKSKNRSVVELLSYKENRFIAYLNTLYADADIDLYIDERNVGEYLKKATRTIEYIKSRYRYINVAEIHNDHGFTRFKLSQVAPSNVKLNCSQVLKNMDIYMNNYGNIYRYHLPVVRMSYNGECIHFYPSCLSTLFTGVNGNYKWFKSQVSAIDIIIKYMRRGFGIVLNENEKKIVKSRLEYLQSLEVQNGVSKELARLKMVRNNTIPVHRMNLLHCTNNLVLQTTNANINQRDKYKMTPEHCNKYGEWKVRSGNIVNPSVIFEKNYTL